MSISIHKRILTGIKGEIDSNTIIVGAFNPFPFKVIIDIYVPIAIFLIVGVDFVIFFLLLYFLTILVPLTFVVKVVWWY